ncbi:MAG: sugar phosphate nucleotidyltransferase [Candidatus Nanoarchaeia archaeon]|nr:sugar phosphate nucleotidyltransferase [Candidatus Nanoarchaeia archaeon]MDD5239493.1 sugar phosphate nucleotidyltransferase [Candidatus Nanoarchaeia archaeon]
MKVVVLAAGKGVRMLPLTADKPKVLIEVAGKPFLYYVLENVRKAGLKDVGIVVNYKKEKVAEFAKHYKGLNLTLIEQKDLGGTACAVLAAKEFAGKDDFIVVMGDNLYSEDDIKALASKKDKFCYIAPYVSGHPQDYGVLALNGDKLLKIDEKPKKPASNFVNTGLYKFTPEIFDSIGKIKISTRGEYELTDAMNLLAKDGKMKVYVLKEYWIDMSSKEALAQVEEDVLSVI